MFKSGTKDFGERDAAGVSRPQHVDQLLARVRVVRVVTRARNGDETLHDLIRWGQIAKIELNEL